PVTSLAIARDRRLVVTGGDTTVRLWRLPKELPATAEEAARDLREELLLRPGSVEVRRRYLAVRSPAQLEADVAESTQRLLEHVAARSSLGWLGPLALSLARSRYRDRLAPFAQLCQALGPLPPEAH